MNGDLFVQTLRAMENVSSVLLEYLNYARDLTSHSPTSTFKLMERSIIMFNSYMAADFNRAFEWVSKLSQQCRVMSYAQFSKAMCVWLSWTYSVFRNVGNYSRDYDYAFKWNHEARLVLIKVSLLQRQLSQTVRQSFFLVWFFSNGHVGIHETDEPVLVRYTNVLIPIPQQVRLEWMVVVQTTAICRATKQCTSAILFYFFSTTYMRQ